MTEYFGKYEVVSVEEPIYEPILEFDTDYNFKGFIDLVLKTPDGKHHVIDWKVSLGVGMLKRDQIGW